MIGTASDVGPKVTDRPHVCPALRQRRRTVNGAGDHGRRARRSSGKHLSRLNESPRDIDFCSIKLRSVIGAERLLKFALMLCRCTFGLHQTRNCVHLGTPFTCEKTSGFSSSRPIVSICNLGSHAAVTAVATLRHFDSLPGLAARSSTVRYEITRSARS